MPDEKNQDSIKSGSGHGGRREGAGRKAGSANRKTREIADKAAAEGVTPLEVMLKAMRALVGRAEKISKDKAGQDDDPAAVQLLVEAAGVAKDAAPYMHAKLQSMTLKGDPDNPLGVSVKLEDAASLKNLVRGNAADPGPQTG